MKARAKRFPEYGPALLSAVLVLYLSGCALPPPRSPAVMPTPMVMPAVLGRDQDYVVVLAAADDTLESLAATYLGDTRSAWMIAEFNRVTRVVPGQDLVIPLRPANPRGISPLGYQAVPILCYHRFGNGQGRLSVSESTFAAQMGYLAREGYHIIPLRALHGFLTGEQALPAKSVVITIDDGYRSTYDIAYPILKQYGFPATVFLYTDFVGARDALGWQQMREMVGSGLIEVQPHSKTHSNLALRLSKESDAQYLARLRSEVTTSVSLIRKHLNADIHSFAYPYGDASSTLTPLLQKAEVQFGLTVIPGGNGFFAPPYLLRRTMVFGDDSIETFKAKLAVFVTADGA